MHRLTLGCLVVGALAACGGDAPVVRDGFSEPVDTGAVSIGTSDGDDPRAVIGRVVAARFTDSGRHVVVLDFAPPYVKVFRRDGVLETAFLSPGGGPREMRFPAALAVSGDSLILVADGTRRVAVFTMDGELRGSGRSPFPVLAAVPGCDGDWLAYGPRFEAGTRPAWLHRLRVGAQGMEVDDLPFTDAFGGGTIGNGLAYGIAHDPTTVRVWHVLGSTPAVVGWTCGATRTEVWPVAPLAARQSGDAQSDAVRMTVRPGNRSLAGMAAVRDGVVLAAQVAPRPGEAAVTEYTLVTSDGERTVAVAGAYTLRDAHPVHGVLVSTTDPVPRLFTIPTDELRAFFDPDG